MTEELSTEEEIQAAVSTVRALSGFQIGDRVRRRYDDGAVSRFAFPPPGAIGIVEEIAPNAANGVVLVRWGEDGLTRRYAHILNLELVL